MLQSPEQIIIIIVIIITYSVWRQFHSLFRSKFSRQRNIMLPLRKQEKSPEKWCLYRIRPSFLICSPVQSPPRNRKFNGPTPGYSLNTVKAPDGPGNRPFQTKEDKNYVIQRPDLIRSVSAFATSKQILSKLFRVLPSISCTSAIILHLDSWFL